MKLYTFPARPLNGGPLHVARPKPPGTTWFYEPKYNGWRALVHILTGLMFNRHGQPLTIDREFLAALQLLRTTLNCQAFQWADCEALERRHNLGRGTLIVLDVIPEPAFAHYRYEQRRAWIKDVLPELHPSYKPEDQSIYRTPAIGAMFTQDWWTRLQELNKSWGCDYYEGLVAKRADAPYPIQLRSSKEETPAWMKHRWAY